MRQYLTPISFELQTSPKHCDRLLPSLFSFTLSLSSPLSRSRSRSLCIWLICIVSMVTLQAQFALNLRHSVLKSPFSWWIRPGSVLLKKFPCGSLFLRIKNLFWFPRRSFCYFEIANWIGFIRRILGRVFGNFDESPKQKEAYASMKTGARKSPPHHHLMQLLLSVKLLLRWFPFNLFTWNGRSC